jgi:hypothetical protein
MGYHEQWRAGDAEEAGVQWPNARLPLSWAGTARTHQQPALGCVVMLPSTQVQPTQAWSFTHRLLHSHHFATTAIPLPDGGRTIMPRFDVTLHLVFSLLSDTCMHDPCSANWEPSELKGREPHLRARVSAHQATRALCWLGQQGTI